METMRTTELAGVIDCDALLMRCLNNLEFAERILGLFHGKCGEELAELEKAFDGGDMDTISKIAHRLAGASANAAASGLHSRASELRHAAVEGSSEKTSQCLQELK